MGDHSNTIRWTCLTLAIGFIVISAAGPGLAEESPVKDYGEIEYGYPDQSIFVASLDGNSRPTSPMRNLAEILLEKANLTFSSRPYPPRRLFNNLKNGKTAFSILVKASSLKDHCIFSRMPVYSTTLRVYFIGDKPPVLTRQDLPGKNVIIIRGYSYAGLRKFIFDPLNKVGYAVAPSHKSAFRMLALGRADYVIDYQSAAQDILADLQIDNVHSHPIDTLDIFLVLSRAYPNAERLMTRLETIVGTLDVNRIIQGHSPPR